jgi:hypothetical protein
MHADDSQPHVLLPPTTKVRVMWVKRPVPAPTEDEPDDDELLRFLDGTMSDEEVAALQARLERCPYALARISILAEALFETDH